VAVFPLYIFKIYAENLLDRISRMDQASPEATPGRQDIFPLPGWQGKSFHPLPASLCELRRTGRGSQRFVVAELFTEHAAPSLQVSTDHSPEAMERLRRRPAGANIFLSSV
jgi:hypothetical protein